MSFLKKNQGITVISIYVISITFLRNFSLEKFDIALASRRYINVSNLIQFLFIEPLVKRIFTLSGEILKIKKSILKIMYIENQEYIELSSFFFFLVSETSRGDSKVSIHFSPSLKSIVLRPL